MELKAVRMLVTSVLRLGKTKMLECFRRDASKRMAMAGFTLNVSKMPVSKPMESRMAFAAAIRICATRILPQWMTNQPSLLEKHHSDGKSIT